MIKKQQYQYNRWKEIAKQKGYYINNIITKHVLTKDRKREEERVIGYAKINIKTNIELEE